MPREAFWKAGCMMTVMGNSGFRRDDIISDSIYGSLLRNCPPSDVFLRKHVAENLDHAVAHIIS